MIDLSSKPAWLQYFDVLHVSVQFNFTCKKTNNTCFVESSMAVMAVGSCKDNKKPQKIIIIHFRSIKPGSSSNVGDEERTYSEDGHFLQQDFLQIMPRASGNGYYFQNCPHV